MLIIGFNDVSWNNADVISPNMQGLADAGIIFDRFYTQPSCSPSRSALMSGRYPIHNGFNEGALGSKQKAGLEYNYTTLAEALKGQGYVSHMVGK